MAKVKVKRAAVKVKKKRWFPLLAPKLFNEQLLGETYIEDKDTVAEKTVTMNLMSLTNDMKKQFMTISFKVDKVDEAQAHTRVVGLQVLPAYIKRQIRRRRDRVDVRTDVKTKDGKKIIVKILLVTKGNTANSVNSLMRKVAEAYVHKHTPERTFEEFIQDIITNQFQKGLAMHLKKVYPIRLCEVRQIKEMKDKA